MKRNKFLALLLTFCCAAGMVACTNDDDAVAESEDSLLREPMTIFRSYKMGYGDSGDGNTEGNTGGTASHYCGVVEGTSNDIQVEWYGIEGCAGYRLKAIVQGRNFENPVDCLVDTVLGPDVLKFRINDLQYNTGFRFAIQTLSKRGEGFHSNWNGYGDGAHPNDYLQIQTAPRYPTPEVFWVENVEKNSFRICWSLKEQPKMGSENFQFEAEHGEYLVDEITVEPSYDNPNAGSFTFNFADYKDQGYIDVEGLQENCVYLINGINKNIKRHWDSLYNTSTIRMKGDPIDPILLKWEDWYDENDVNTRAKELKAARIDTMLAHYMVSKDYPEGTIFELEPKKVYYVQNTVNMSKGFTLRCSDPNVAPEDRPLVFLGIGWQKKVPNPDPATVETIPEVVYGVTKAEADMGLGYPDPCSCTFNFGRNAYPGEMGGINVLDIVFEDINFDCDGAYNVLNKPEQKPKAEGLGNYFINMSSQAMPFTLSKFELRSCNFRNMVRGLIRFQGPNRKKIDHFIIDDCMFYGCGVYLDNGRGYSWITGDGTMPLHNVLRDFSWTNSTFIDSPRHAVISENKNTKWDSSVTWNINFSNNTLINCSTRSKDRLIFEMRYAPANITLTCKNNLFVIVRKDDNDKRKLFAAGMRIEGRGEGTVYHFSDNYAPARPDYADETMKTTDAGAALTDYLWTSYQFSHTSRGANNSGVDGGGNQPLNGGDPEEETKIKLITSADGTYLTAADLMEDPLPKSAEGDVDMHANYRSHKLNLDGVEVDHRIPDGFKIKAQYKSLMVNAQGETIGDPRWLK